MMITTMMTSLMSRWGPALRGCLNSPSKKRLSPFQWAAPSSSSVGRIRELEIKNNKNSTTNKRCVTKPDLLLNSLYFLCLRASYSPCSLPCFSLPSVGFVYSAISWSTIRSSPTSSWSSSCSAPSRWLLRIQYATFPLAISYVNYCCDCCRTVMKATPYFLFVVFNHYLILSDSAY